MVTPMASMQAQSGKTRPSLLVMCVTVVTLVIFARLGFWQLARANEKIEIMRAAEMAQSEPPLLQLDEVNPDNLYRHIKLFGQFDFKHQFLRDNVVVDKQPGYEVLTPFIIQSASGTSINKAILVNRGWVPLGPDRRQPPDVSPSDVALPHHVSGILVQPSKGFTLGEALDPSQQRWPLVTQFLDYETLSDRLATIPLLHAVVVLEEGHPQTMRYSWQPVADGPEKHYGYAFQWFAMLAAVVILFFYLNFFKNDEPDST